MAEGRHYAAMDAARATTEFGSKRFHDKIDQNHTETHHDNSGPSSSGSRFILPLRETRAAESETTKPSEHKKRSFFKLRHKVSLLHSRAPQPVAEVVEPVVPCIRPSTESTRKSVPLDQLVSGLPIELQIQVVSHLPLTDILNLRLTSKSWHSIITLNETAIVRHHLKHHIPAYAQRLYPVTDPSELNFHYLCGLWHRLHVAAKLAFLICEWVTKDIFLRQTEAQRAAFAPQHERMRRRLIPLLFTVFHFFETYRKLHLDFIAEHGGHGLQREPYTLNPVEKQIMDMYDDQTLLRVHEIFPLVVASFCRRLRPPTYVGRVERSLRGYIREKPSDDVHVAILCLGGLRQVERIWEIKGYNSRRSAVDTFYNGLTKDAPFENGTKTRRSLMSFGRKKSTSGAEREQSHREHHRSSFSSLHRTRSPTGSIDLDHNWIFNTSLSAAAPMSQLEQDQAQTILDDLPVLQHIWTLTAETLIIERGIVKSAQDIKRNQQVMLHLIQEDALDEEDEWWYGRNIPDSVRPRNGVADDDAD